MSDQVMLSDLKHCCIQEIAHGVYIAQPNAGGGAASNAGIIALGDATIIFDSMLTIAAATELRKAAELLTGTPIKMVINSHHHEDHVGGNQVFDPVVDIVSTAHTRRLMTEQRPQQMAWHKHHAQSRLAELEAALANATEGNKESAQNAYAEYQQIIAELDTMVVRLPNVTFEQQMCFYGSDRRVEINTYGGGHTQSDTILHLPDDGIVFMGDLLTTRNHPFLSDGDPGELPRILDIISLLNPTQIVPGHGPVSSIDDIQAMQAYLALLTETALTELAFQFEDEIELEQKVTTFQIPTIYKDWGRPNYFISNLRFLYQRVMNAYAD